MRLRDIARLMADDIRDWFWSLAKWTLIIGGVLYMLALLMER